MFTESAGKRKHGKKTSFVFYSYFSHEYALREIKIDFHEWCFMSEYVSTFNKWPCKLFFVILYLFLFCKGTLILYCCGKVLATNRSFMEMRFTELWNSWTEN